MLDYDAIVTVLQLLLILIEIIDPKLVELLQNRSKKSNNTDKIKPIVESMDVEQKLNDTVAANSDMDVDVEKGNRKIRRIVV